MKRIGRIMAALLALALCLSACGAMADGRVTTTGTVHLRKGPGLDYSEITTIPEGVSLSYTKSARDERGVTWYYVKYDGRKGWVSSKYAKTGKSGGGSSNPGEVTTTGTVHLRSGPGLDYRVLTTIDSDETLDYDKTSVDDRGVTWYRVWYGGERGWVSSVYAKKGGGYSDGTRVRTTAGINVRLGPGLYYDRIGYLSEDSSVPYLDSARRDERGVVWYKISYRGDVGWVSSEYAYIS